MNIIRANAKEGIHFPTVNKFVNLMKESEEVISCKFFQREIWIGLE